jgi:hypothetical protein
MQSVGAVTFAKVNSCTYRVGTRNKRAAGWLMEVAWPGGSRQRWVARIGDQASEPLPLEEAKQAAIAFLREKGKVKPRHVIADLNQVSANEVDRAVLQRERRKWPFNIMGGGAAPRGVDDSRDARNNFEHRGFWRRQIGRTYAPSRRLLPNRILRGRGVRGARVS